MVLAELSPPSPAFVGQTVLVWCLIGGTLGLLVVAIISLVLKSRRHPPVSEEMYRDFLKRDEWLLNADKLHRRIDETHERINDLGQESIDRMDVLRREMTKGFSDIE